MKGLEVKTSLLRAVQQSTRKLASAEKLDTILNEVLTICLDAVGAAGGTIYLHDPSSHRLVFQYVQPPSVQARLPRLDISDDYGTAGAAFQQRKTVARVFDVKPREDFNEFELATGSQVLSIVATPLQMEDESPIGVVQLINKTDGAFSDEDIAVLDTIAAVSTMAYLNARLSEESSRASTLLGMGKVSHDIGNLAASLYANVSLLEMQLTSESPKGKKQSAISEEVVEMVDDIRKSIDRIVGYSRLVSDMSAGKAPRPNFEIGSLAETIEDAAAYLSSEARKLHIELQIDVDQTAPEIPHDRLFVLRIVQNLVGNAIKAVRETIDPDEAAEMDIDDETYLGKVGVKYFFQDGTHILEVTDSGPGMSESIRKMLLSGNARSQWDKGAGSGWGMKIVLELAAAHNAQVEIESRLGTGSTFKVLFPSEVARLNLK